MEVGGPLGDVVQLASQQRAAEPGEPTCVVCGRFGEYVCDATDEDVCSLECRDVCTKQYADAAHAKDRTFTSDPAEDLQAEVRLRLHIQVEHVGASDVKPPSLLDSFDSLPEEVRVNLAARGFEHLTPVQMQMIPAVLTGAHLLVSAPTGTGKTAAFLVPLVVQIMDLRFGVEASGPLALILAPVRELAMQIEDEAKALMKGIAKMKTALIVGGLPVPPQLHRLRQGVQLLVATPGRLLDILVHHCEGVLEQLLDGVRFCIVDEVDMMLSVGFHNELPQIVGVLSASESNVQMIFTSATVSKQVEEMVARSLGVSAVYTRIRVGQSRSEGELDGLVMNMEVRHSILWREEKAKKLELFRYLQENRTGQTLVFVGSKAGADMLASAIGKQCYHLRARSFHAGKSQEEKLKLLEEFVEEKLQILVSTNILGRGIDLLTVDSIVIFDAPRTISEYVHIVGRVGRGASGTELSVGSTMMYVNARDASIFSDLVDLYRNYQLKIPEEVYSALRAESARKERPMTALVAVDDAKRAYRTIRGLESDFSDVTAVWSSWKAKKRIRSA